MVCIIFSCFSYIKINEGWVLCKNFMYILNSIGVNISRPRWHDQYSKTSLEFDYKMSLKQGCALKKVLYSITQITNNFTAKCP